MANSQKAYGLQPYQPSSGEVYRSRPYYVPASYATNLFIGDTVIMTGTSNTTATGSARQYQPGSLAEINKCSFGANNKVLGVVTGIIYLNQSPFNPFGYTYRPASVEAVVMVCDDPNAIYSVQSNATAAITAAMVGANANLIDGTGDTIEGISGIQLNSSSVIADATYQLQVLSLVNMLNNDLGTYADLLVKINLPQLAPGIAGV